ncbi:thioredoxin family protein [Actinomadura sp. 6N118]|uniref:thioredoxin family protein n=1 Tax=Actinomadura sp. 6N118 TaxID=3375151 RepID=UPI0037B30D9E
MSAHPRTKLPDGYDPKRNAAADIAAATAKAKADRLPVLLDFGADWCPDCNDLQHLLRTRTVRPLIGAYHVVTIDVGRFNRRLDLAQKYGLALKDTGIPAVVILSPDGEIRFAGSNGLHRNADSTDEMTADSVAAFLRRYQ